MNELQVHSMRGRCRDDILRFVRLRETPPTQAIHHLRLVRSLPCLCPFCLPVAEECRHEVRGSETWRLRRGTRCDLRVERESFSLQAHLPWKKAATPGMMAGGGEQWIELTPQRMTADEVDVNLLVAHQISVTSKVSSGISLNSWGRSCRPEGSWFLGTIVVQTDH